MSRLPDLMTFSPPGYPSNHAAGPSNPHRRQPSTSTANNGPSYPSKQPLIMDQAAIHDQFLDAEDLDDFEGGQGGEGDDSFDFRAQLMDSFDPPPPRSMAAATTVPVHPFRTAQPQPQHQPQPHSTPATKSPMIPTSPYSSSSYAYPSLTTPPRERMITSGSNASFSPTLRGNRAPAPAALDLSPKSDRSMRNDGKSDFGRYGSLADIGLGAPPGNVETRRIVTEPAETVSCFSC